MANQEHNTCSMTATSAWIALSLTLARQTFWGLSSDVSLRKANLLGTR
jgi:hypothetical protein